LLTPADFFAFFLNNHLLSMGVLTMFPSFLMSRRLPPLDHHEIGEWFDDGILHARSVKRSRQGSQDNDDNNETASSKAFGNEPPRPPVGTTLKDEPLPIWELRILQTAYLKAMTYLCGRLPEAAGILLSLQHDDSVITEFVPDDSGRGTAVSFELDAVKLNRVLKEKKSVGLTCMGIVHSHPAGVIQPSFGDLVYFRKLFAAPANGEAQHLFVPIICNGRMYPYVFAQDHVYPAQLTLV
jgi:proteasome lid subunit RPN8/RPN11